MHLQASARQQSSFPCHQLIVSILHRQDGDWLQQTVLCNTGCQLFNFFLIEHLSWLIRIRFDFIFRDQDHLVDHLLFCKQCFHNSLYLLNLVLFLPKSQSERSDFTPFGCWHLRYDGSRKVCRCVLGRRTRRAKERKIGIEKAWTEPSICCPQPVSMVLS